MTEYEGRAEETLAGLLKQRTILNVRKRRHQKLLTVLVNAEPLVKTRKFCAEGVPGLEDEAARYLVAVVVLEKSGGDWERFKQEKAELCDHLAEVNREIRDMRKILKMCAKIKENAPKIQRDIQKTESVQQKKKRRQQIRQGVSIRDALKTVYKVL